VKHSLLSYGTRGVKSLGILNRGKKREKPEGAGKKLERQEKRNRFLAD
jgi:hypothetical protein